MSGGIKIQGKMPPTGDNVMDEFMREMDEAGAMDLGIMLERPSALPVRIVGGGVAVTIPNGQMIGKVTFEMGYSQIDDFRKILRLGRLCLEERAKVLEELKNPAWIYVPGQSPASDESIIDRLKAKGLLDF